MSRIAVVSGGLGFIGSHLTERLLSRDYEVVVINKPDVGFENWQQMQKHPKIKNASLILDNLMQLENVKKHVEGASVFFHLAALTSHRLSINEPHQYVSLNVTAMLNVLEASRVVEPPPKVVFASSSSVYGKHPPPWVESMEPKPEGPYALSKYFSERLCQLYHQLYGVEVTIVRYFNVIGERARGNIVLKIFVDRVLSGEPPLVNGRTDEKGEFQPAVRDFTYVGDVVDGTILAGERREANGEVINLGGGRPRSVLELAEMVIEQLRAKGKIKPVFRELAPHESLVSYSDNTKALTLLGWRPKVQLEEAVRRYCDWHLELSRGSS